MLSFPILVLSLVYAASAYSALKIHEPPPGEPPSSERRSLLRRQERQKPVTNSHVSMNGWVPHFLQRADADARQMQDADADAGAVDVLSDADARGSPHPGALDQQNKTKEHLGSTPKGAALAEEEQKNKLTRAYTSLELEASLRLGKPQRGEERRGQDEIDGKIERLKDEDEALYQKLFPEEERATERVEANKAAQSVLEVSHGKAFRIKIPQGKTRLCLTEANSGYIVRAEPCRKGSSRQKWYWAGDSLMNLHSSHRCLGLSHHKNHVKTQFESLAEIQQKKAEAKGEDEAHGLHLSMKHQCSDSHPSLKWFVNEKGVLANKMNQQCMANSIYQDQDAVVLPCDGDKPFWKKNSKAKESKEKSWFS